MPPRESPSPQPNDTTADITRNTTVAPDMTDRPPRIDERDELTGPRKGDTPPPPQLPELARAYGAQMMARDGACPQPACKGRELQPIAKGVGFCPSCVAHYATR